MTPALLHHPMQRNSLMLSPISDRTSGRRFLLMGALLAGLVLATAERPARAADDAKTDTSLSLVPADVAFYGSSLRNKEWLDRFTKSNAYKMLRSLPIVKDGFAKAKEKLGQEGGPLEHYKKFTEVPENKELISLLGDAFSHEVFYYGGKEWNNFMTLYMQTYLSMSFAPLQALMSGRFAPDEINKIQLRGALNALQKNRDKIKTPETVFGFKLSSPKKVIAQLDRLEKLLEHVAASQPMVKDRIKRVKAAGGDFITAALDGTLIPWDNVPIGEIEENKGEFDNLIKQLKETKLTVSIGVKGNYLLLGITPTVEDLARFAGKGKSLAERDEMKPLAKFADKPICVIGYASKAFAGGAAGWMSSFDGMLKPLKDALNKSDLKDERKKAITKDLDELAGAIKSYKPVYGATMGFSYLTNTGSEGYNYRYEVGARFRDVSCNLQNHFGGNPIFAAAFAFKVNGTAYATGISYLKKIYGHAEAVFFDMADDDAKDKYKQATKGIFPLLKQLDDATTKLLIPSLKETGLGLVIDSKWSSKQWHRDLPEMPKAMPMLEVGVLLGLSDPKKFSAALKEYRTTINELYAKVREASQDNIPEFKIPASEVEKGKNGNLHYYPLPEEAGLDKQVQPVMGIGKKLAVFCLSKQHAERLLSDTPLKAESGPLARKGNVVGVAMLNFPAFVDAIEPWVEFGVQATVGAPDPETAKKMSEEILKQVRVGLKVLRAFKGFTAVTYVEDDALVTHSETVFKDVPAE
jgi:hypothetical protein